MKNVAIIDSGSGGINVLKTLLQECEGFNFLYLADTAYAPYGEKSKKFLKSRAEELVLFLKKIFSPEIIVFACNTLTAVAIKSVRKSHPEIEFVGCEPAIKPACEKFDQKDVLVLATPVTIKESRLIKKYPQLQTMALPELPMLIDQNLFELENLNEYLAQILKDASSPAVVLGCTHFEAVRGQIADLTGAEIFGSSEGIAKRLQTFSDGDHQTNCSFMTTGDPEILPKFYHYLTKNS